MGRRIALSPTLKEAERAIQVVAGVPSGKRSDHSVMHRMIE